MRVLPTLRRLAESARSRSAVRPVHVVRTHDDDEPQPLDSIVDGRALRVLLVTARYLPDRGGTEIHTHQVATRMAALGADVSVLSTAPRGPFEHESHDGPVRVILVRSWPPGRDYYLAPEIVRIIRRGPTDVVHCQGYHTFVAPLVMLSALSARIPYVVTLHSGGHSSRLRRAIRPAQATVLRPLLCRAHQLVASSSFEADLFARRTRIPRERFVVIPSGVDLPTTSNPQAPSDPPLLLSIGRLESYKGHHRIIEALPALQQARPGLKLRLVGDGPYEDTLRSLADQLGVAGSLEFGTVPADRRDEMAELMQRASCVLMLSDYESQGLAIQEALGIGRPIVVSDNSALRDLSGHPNVRTLGREASKADVAAAIIGLLDTPPVAPPKVFTWDECVSALLAIYLNTLAGGR